MKNLKHKPRIFIGSSSEAEIIDRQVTNIIEKFGVEVISWKNIYKPGDYPLDVLVHLPSSIDGALFIVTPDDSAVFKSMDLMFPRGNVIFELGIFISQLGKYRTGIVHVILPNEPSATLPSDLDGLTVIKYLPEEPGQNQFQLELWLEEVLSYVNSTNPIVGELTELLKKNLYTFPSSWREVFQQYIETLETSIDHAFKGEIDISSGRYYDALFSEIDNTTINDKVMAVGTLSPLIWKDDPEQQYYLEKNLIAVERGVNIRRLFILSDEQWGQIGPVLKKQIDKGIEIRRAPQEFFGKYFNIQDMVIFNNKLSKGLRAYVTELSKNPKRITKSRIIVNEEIITDHIDTFEKIWDISLKINSKNIPKLTAVKKLSKPPCINLEEYKLDKPVVTCMEAAQAKGIPLENELKTLLLDTSNGFVAIELPGDAMASLKKIKDFLEVKKAHLADPKTLAELGLEPGTVSAVSPPIWSMHHLVSKRLLNLDEVSTNSGNKTGYYRFEPSLLLKAKKVNIGDFEEEYMDE